MKTINSWRNREAIAKGKLLIGYLLAGYPSRENSLLQIKDCDIAGLDVFEIGYPASDPVSDGEVIQRAHRLVDGGVSQIWIIEKTARRN
jgi:tryptophan synthase alpha chain